MKSLHTVGIIPTIKNSRLRIFAIVDPSKKVDGEVKIKLLDDYLTEYPVCYSGLSEFQAVNLGLGYCSPSDKVKNKYEYNLVTIDPEFHVGNLDDNRQFSSQPKNLEPEKKVSFADIEDFISWINHPQDKPELLARFESVDGYVQVMNSALKVLTDKLISDYKFNELVEGITGQGIKGVISVKTDEVGQPTTEIDKTFSFDSIEVNKLFSAISLSDPDTRQFSKGNFIGTLSDGLKFIKFFHWTTNVYSHHMAFDELYDGLGDSIDALAEKCIKDEEITTFANEIFPKGDPVDYLKRFKYYIIESGKVLFGSREDGSSYQSLIDDITNKIDSCLYRLTKLGGTTQKTF